MSTNALTAVQLLAEIEDLLRAMPPRATIRHLTDDNFDWLGRAAAIVANWNADSRAEWNRIMEQFHDRSASRATQGYHAMMVLLHKVRNDLRMRTVGPTNLSVAQGGVFDYFDEIRKAIELATEEVLFVDPYLDADFVSRYLPHVRQGVAVRLLTGDKKLSSLLPAVALFSQQNGMNVAVRSTEGLHDRYVLIDKKNCFQSGASFKDGAKRAPTTLTQITDAFPAVLNTYEQMWSTAKVER